jgi:hypothetical protein
MKVIQATLPKEIKAQTLVLYCTSYVKEKLQTNTMCLGTKQT